MYKHFFKRVFDLFVSGLALIILSPVFLILAIVVKINMRGQVIFKQVRPGKNGKLFVMYKFRTMKNTRGADGNLLPDEVRRTKFGDMLRKTSLDELPQLWNIFIGNMSFVGPRPQMVWNVMFYDETVCSLNAKPGLTCINQVEGRNGNSWEKMFENDKKYCEKITFWRDISLLFKTVGVVFKKSNAERTEYKWYAEKLLAENKISQDDLEKSFIEANKIERTFLEEKQGYLSLYKKEEKAICNEKRHYQKKKAV